VGWLALTTSQVVRLLPGDQELGGLGVGLQRVGGDHHPGKVQGRQQRGEGGHLLGCAADLALGQHRAALVVHRRQQVHRAATCACWMGAAQRLAVDGDRPPASCGSATVPIQVAVPVGQPGADRAGYRVWVQARKRAADGGLGRNTPVAGSLLAGAERDPDRLGRVGGPLGDRGDRPSPGQDRGGRQAQDGDQRVAAATGRSRVGDAGQVGEQARGFAVVEGFGVGQSSERGWDRG
jgi:hypothetical protein